MIRVGGVVRLREIVRDGRARLVRYGRELIENASRIDAAVPQAVMLDVLNVDPADRRLVAQGDGITAIAVIRGLEDSAVHRGDPRQGPLAQAVSEFMADALVRNEQLSRAADWRLIGKGGLLEIVPAGAAELIRLPVPVQQDVDAGRSRPPRQQLS